MIRIAIAVALAVVTWWAYSTSFRGVFLDGDDQELVFSSGNFRQTRRNRIWIREITELGRELRDGVRIGEGGIA